MAPLNLKNFSGKQVKQIIDTRNNLNFIFEKNSDLIQKRESDYYWDVFSNDERFNFGIYSLRNGPSKETLSDVFCTMQFEPISFDNITKTVLQGKFIDSAKLFEGWIVIVKDYNEVLNEYYDPYYKQFEKEFEDEFNFGGAEQDTSTLDSDNQLKVYKLLSHIEETIKKEDQSNPEIQKLLSFTGNFKENLHTLPKSIIKKKAIQLLSKLRKIGIKLYFDTLDIGYKKIIKAGLIAAAANADHVLKLLH